MPLINLNDNLKNEYRNLFDSCMIREAKINAVEIIIQKIIANRLRYENAGSTAGVPWYFIAVIHNMESSLNFNRHLHNGDPLTAKTIHVPAGRPVNGTPPFTWEESAADSLMLQKLNQWTDWSLTGILYKIEEYNGWGYRTRHPEVYSPYLWSFSNHYSKGKYIADGTWSATAASNQCGAAVILRRMAEKKIVLFDGEPAVPENIPPLRYSKKEIQYAKELQTFLNTFPGVYVKVDGIPGQKTSDAFKAVTGRFLDGDPRENS